MDSISVMERYMYKNELRRFNIHLINYLDEKVDNMLNEMKEDYTKAVIAYSNYILERDESNLNENCINTIQPKYMDDIEKLQLGNNITALIETKIIYLWKIFEIRLKELIGISYNANTKDFYKIESIISFLKSQEINIKEIKDYKIIDEILRVNNQCKHAGLKWSKEIGNIKEFSKCQENDGYIHFAKAEHFYNRVKNIPSKFLNEIKEAILKERLSFDEVKYREIAKPLVKRMEQDKAIEFVNVFLDMYGLKPENLVKKGFE